MAAKKKTKKSTGPTLSRKYDTKYIGNEMEFDKVDFDTLSERDRRLMQSQALNWYAYMYDVKKDYRDVIKSYAKELGWSAADITGLNGIQFENEHTGFMKLVRMYQLGWKLDEREAGHVSNLMVRLKGLVTEARKSVTESKPRVVRKAHDSDTQILYELEYDFEDVVIENKEIPEFNLYDRIRTFNPSRTILNGVVREWLEGRIAEAKTAESKEIYGVRFQKKLVKVYEAMVVDLDRSLVTPKRVSKPRVKKKTPAVRQIRDLKYLKESSEYKVVSINPEKVVGANNVLVFNTKYRKLIWYFSTGGFEVSGTSLKGANSSTQKTLRKPEEQLQAFLKTDAKTKLTKAFAAIKSSESQASGRLNDNCIIMKAF